MNDAASREISITRIVDAPAELVFKAWTEAAHLEKWWGPEGFTVASAESDARPGGAFTIVMRGPDGTDYPMSGVYRECDPPRRLVTDARALDAEGRTLLEAVTTVTLVERDGKTELTVAERAVAVVPEAVQMLAGMEVGMTQSLRRLEDTLTGAGERQILLLHMYEFPRERVFDAWTSPEHLAHWWGPNGFTISTEAFDLRPGGAWRFTMHGPDGVDYPNLIVFDEIDPAALLSYEHSGQPDDEDPRFHVTVTFDDFMGMTVLTSRMVFATVDARDLVVEKYGAIEDGNQTLDRLGAYLVTG